MKLDYVLMNPTENRTILVETPVPAASQPLYAARLLELEPTAEQVGFLSSGDEDCDIALRMAGGEFCGNAAMSAAAYRCAALGLCGGTLRVRVSGAARPVTVTLAGRRPAGFTAEVEMPRPTAVETVSLALDGQMLALPLVRFEGIFHIVLTRPVERTAAERAVRRWCAELGAEGLGLMLLDEAAGTLTPLVYIPGGDTLYWEHACASGTTAVGAYLARRGGGTVCRRFAEPGGSLGIFAAADGRLLLQGIVSELSRASVEI